MSKIGSSKPGTGDLLSKAVSIVKGEKVEEDPVAPVVDDELLKTVNRRKAAKRRSGGRAGTILTEASTLG